VGYDRYKVDLPEGQSGDWAVEKFTVDEHGAQMSSLAGFIGGHGRHVPEGTYTKLTRDGDIVMTDTPNEIRDHLVFISEAHGRVLIHGLGLGMCVAACLEKEKVDHVTVVELCAEVIELVGVHLKEKYGDRLEIIEDDALTWKPPKGTRWDVAWHDIWDNICADNIEEMSRLHRRFGRRVEWQGSWCRDMVKEQRAREGAW
jgi:hypothetical protein